MELVHTEEYVDKFFNGKTTAAEQRKTGFVWNEGLVRRCRLETGEGQQILVMVVQPGTLPDLMSLWKATK